MNNGIKVTVILPCLNEEESIGICVDKCNTVFEEKGINAEVLVIDNGSTDKSASIAEAKGARVVAQPIRGYGAAYLKGLEEANGEFIVMGDADNTYDFLEIPKLLEYLEQGYEFVIGSRFMGDMKKNAMPFANRYIGNPILTAMLNICFKSKVSDAHSGFRAIRKCILPRLDLKTTGMEFASEMIVAALREKVKIKETSIVYYPRIGESKLNPLVDAWRHVRFMLLFSPDWLFIFPGFVLFVLGMCALILSGFGSLNLFGHRFDVHAMMFFAFFALLGLQVIGLGLFAKAYGWVEGYIKEDRLFTFILKTFNLERGLLLGGLISLGGLLGFAFIVFQWFRAEFGALNYSKLSIIALTFMCCGIQVIFSSFFLSVLGISKKR